MFFYFESKKLRPPAHSPFFDHLSFFLIRIFWIRQDPPPLMRIMVKNGQKMVKNGQQTVKKWSTNGQQMVKKPEFFLIGIFWIGRDPPSPFDRKQKKQFFYASPKGASVPVSFLRCDASTVCQCVCEGTVLTLEGFDNQTCPLLRYGASTALCV